MYVVVGRGISTRVLVRRDGGLCAGAVLRTWHGRGIKGTATAAQPTKLGPGMFQQKVLFAERIAAAASTELLTPLPSQIAVCLFVFPWSP